ncbi:MAG: choice-of-anchor J domain-containing protein [Prevotella sp.]|nr:choice-of-anchor J domain-containing protein [Prevotella sp.]
MKKKFLIGALVALFAAPTALFAQSTVQDVQINGCLINWYAYGKDPTDGTPNTWFQVPIGGFGTPCNYGAVYLTIDGNATENSGIKSVDYLARTWLMMGLQGAVGVYTGDAYYTMYEHEVGTDIEGEYGSETREIVTRKWNPVTWTYTTLEKKCKYSPTDLTYDPINDVVYGVFYINSGDESGYKLGTLDMETMEVSFISKQFMWLGSEMRALAISRDGIIYGLTSSGDVYTLSKEDGTLKTVGNVGFKTQQRLMSMTFDFRTNKLYWIGFMNEGKIPGATDGTNTTLSIAEGGRDTGLYEIDINTGKATLIGSTDADDGTAGKMQITGLWVEGSFEKKNIDQKIEFVSVPPQVLAGESFQIIANVKNIGKQAVGEDDWKVNFYVNGGLVGSKSGRDQEPGESRDVKFDVAAPAYPGALKIYAELVNDKDEQAANNKTEEKPVAVISTVLLPEVTLVGEAAERGIKLTWEDPDGYFTDGAEDYVAFTYDNLGAWTMYDGDKGYTQRPSDWSGSISYPNANTPKAFIVFNPAQSGIYNTGSAMMFVPHSGYQYFAAFFTAVPDESSESGGKQIANDDWMISPELNGKAQTIRFFAKGYQGTEYTGYETETKYYEKVRVLYSTTDTNPESFVEAADTITVNPKEWTEYTFDVPEGAKYFAINCVSDDGFVLMIDDIEFKTAPKEVKSYNIYRDGLFIATVDGNVHEFTDPRAQNNDQFTVTAVYDEGESRPSNAVSISHTTAVENIRTSAGKATTDGIFTINGMRVNGMNRPGLYIIRQDGKTSKVMVK